MADRDNFVAALAQAGAAAPEQTLTALADRLIARWSESHRGYHDREHLCEVLAGLVYLSQATPVAVLGAWFHDAIYQGRPGEDERASAELAERELAHAQVPGAVIAAVRDAVLASIEHNPNLAPDQQGWSDQAGLLDADLAILAAQPDRYARYVSGVRAEYAHLDAATFRAGRRTVLTALLAAEPLFHTEAGTRRWQADARRNLRAELTSLDR